MTLNLPAWDNYGLIFNKEPKLFKSLTDLYIQFTLPNITVIDKQTQKLIYEIRKKVLKAVMTVNDIHKKDIASAIAKSNIKDFITIIMKYKAGYEGNSWDIIKSIQIDGLKKIIDAFSFLHKHKYGCNCVCGALYVLCWGDMYGLIGNQIWAEANESHIWIVLKSDNKDITFDTTCKCIAEGFEESATTIKIIDFCIIKYKYPIYKVDTYNKIVNLYIGEELVSLNRKSYDKHKVKRILNYLIPMPINEQMPSHAIRFIEFNLNLTPEERLLKYFKLLNSIGERNLEIAFISVITGVSGYILSEISDISSTKNLHPEKIQLLIEMNDIFQDMLMTFKEKLKLQKIPEKIDVLLEHAKKLNKLLLLLSEQISHNII